MRAALARAGRWGLVLLLMAGLVGCDPAPQPRASSPAQASAVAAAEAETTRFLKRHWARPLAPQGPLPAAMTGQGLLLAPQSCAGCHAQQVADWRQSLHSRAMGPGVLGQLLNMPAQARDDHQSCLRCHAPLAEQADSLVAALEALAAWDQDKREPPDRAAKLVPLHEQGLVCAGCHVRANAWHGPPRRDGSAPAAAASAAAHGGWTASAAFESSQFCAACHQFDDGDYALNGKLLENTVREWQASRYAQQGTSCQSCHMPDRRHLWRGIHDPAMVKGGVAIRADAVAVASSQVSARLRVTNSGVGHYFPTYVTPRVVIRGVQIDAAGRPLPGTEQEFVIGRQVTLDLSREIADTRIAPDAEAAFDYRAPRHARASALAWSVEVQPDAFYLDFYEALLRDAPAGPGRQLIVRARDEARASPYALYARRLPLP